MSTTIARNDYYTIDIDEKKNRLYLTIVGYWKSRDVVSNYIGDLVNASGKLSPNFTVLTDVTQMKTPHQSVVSLHLEAQKVLLEAGLKKTAELVGADAIVKMSLGRFSNESGMPKGTFDNKQEAEAWLDKDA